MNIIRNHPLKEFTWYGLNKRLRGKRSYKTAKQSGLRPIYCPEATLRIFLTSECNGGCWYCTNLLLPDWKNQYRYTHLKASEFAKGLNRFYGNYQYYFSGGECALRPDFPELIDSMYKANIVLLTNLSDKSVEGINKINTKNNILVDISYHPHMMELTKFVDNYNAIKFEKKVHVIEFINVATQEIIAALSRYGVQAKSTHGIYDEGAKTRATKTVNCKCSNIHIDPEGGIHTCRTRTIQKREPMANILDECISSDLFTQFIECSDYGVCSSCDLMREIC